MGKRSQVDIAYDYIRNAIIAKEFFPGSRIVEEDIVRNTGVSRTSVRSALTKLRYEGIVDTTANRGTSVTRHSVQDIRSVFAIRQVLEIGAFEQAVNHITPEALARMWQQNEALKKMSGNFSISEFVTHNRAFHWEIVSAANNKYYEKFGLYPGIRTVKKSTSCCRIETTAGGVVMSRQYVKMESLSEEVFRRKAVGETNREIVESYGLAKHQIKQLVSRQKRKTVP